MLNSDNKDVEGYRNYEDLASILDRSGHSNLNDQSSLTHQYHNLAKHV